MKSELTKSEYPKLICKFTLFFGIIFILGSMFAVPYLYIQEKNYIPETSIINDNPDDILNSLFIFAYILILTGLILIFAKRFSIGWLIAILDSFLIFFTFALLFSYLLTFILYAFGIPNYFAILLALALVFLRRLIPKNKMIKNIVAIGAISIVGVLLGAALGIYPMILLLIILSIYDLVAVFKTKHMITLAKTFEKENTSFSLTLLAQIKKKAKNLASRVKKTVKRKTSISKGKNLAKQEVEIPNSDKKTFELGTGDLVLPLAFFVTILKYSTINKAVLCVFAAYLGLALTIRYSYYTKKPMPALPFQSLLMIIAYFLPF